MIRAFGPSLPVPNALADPTVDLYEANGTMLQSNDNWRGPQEAEIIAAQVAPTRDPTPR